MINHSVFMTKFAGILSRFLDPEVEAMARKAQKAKAGAKSINVKIPKKWIGKAGLVGTGMVGGAYLNDAYQSYLMGSQMRRAQNM